MTQEKKSALTFPCEFPIKVFGNATDEFEKFVMDTIYKTLPGTDMNAVSKRPSKDGKYIALTILVNAESQEELDQIYQDLSANPIVLMAL
jgi:putative lipoic acid-binding regulatory protein